ncbi:MurR/RpiR family transcriptional regulator [Clostridium thermobutyricum]|uniref:MurR/RpiR family transcriptional regulator n=1 Tax=Clostridium thermobutyricum TaxID=29372 RepID=UPI0025887793|nr:MurR/RpiR family transcriptional regulator [Clostridium thermobutyricum]
MFNTEVLSDLNDLEINIYNYIMKNKNSVVYMRIRELADETHVSTTTILRFCKKFGCDGFSEFKINLKMKLNEDKTIDIKNDKAILLEFLDRTETANFKRDVQECINIINEANNIFCVGFGNSGDLASYTSRYLASLGIFSLHIGDPYYPTEKMNLENGVSIIFSVSGESSQIIIYANAVKRNGGKIVSITNNKNCTLAKLSDANISYYVPMEKNGHHQLTIQTPVIYIVEYIAREINKIKQMK